MELRVKEGEVVTKGMPLVVLSAMKMEMIVQAPLSGVIERVYIAKDMKLEAEDLILTIVAEKK